MYCPNCGTQLPDDAAFCMKCGASIKSSQQEVKPATQAPVLAPLQAKVLKCPQCGAPITPKYGEMIITCDYCGSGVALSGEGWRSISARFRS